MSSLSGCSGVAPGTDADLGVSSCYAVMPAMCNGLCVDISSDRRHCGGCNMACVSPGVCHVGACKIMCGALTLCEKERACVDLTSDPKHCGSCDNACPDGTCQRGRCVAACTFPNTLCDVSCVDLTSDRTHCGNCMTVCPTGQACVDGGCTFTCPPSLTNCAGECVALDKNPTHCGTCDKACVKGQVCSNGQCTSGCQQGLLPCPGGCANLLTDPRNCGACNLICPKGTVCSLANCVSQCDPGLDSSCVPGACVDLTSDPGHCGGCDKACPVEQPCSMRRCVPACDHGLSQCGGSCVNLLTDPRNCGGCGTACVKAKVCSLGRCVDRCDPGLDAKCVVGGCVNRTNNAGHCGACDNVCPLTSVCSLGQCAMACDPGLRACNGVCADLATDTAHCGNCATLCKTGELCSQGTCVAQCAPGPDDAGVGPPAQSPCGTTCRDLASDPLNCGQCDKVCGPAAHGQPGCVMSACAPVCDAGFADCDAIYANGCEVDLKSDARHCGSCAGACKVVNGVGQCAMGVCGVGACVMGYDDCDKQYGDGCETSLNTDASNCGKCGLACPAAANALPACNGGMCDVKCVSGHGNCDANPKNGCETDLTNDPKNCNLCGTVCPAVTNGVPGCTASVCGVGACNMGFGDCNKSPADGCEANLQTDANNCGGCAIACPAQANATAACRLGVCGIGACAPGWADCDNNPKNGCEVNLQNDVNNCGTCTSACPPVANGTPACTAGKCGIAQCKQGFRDCNLIAQDGCEVNLTTDTKNCGTCNNVCPPAANGPKCTAGVCG